MSRCTICKHRTAVCYVEKQTKVFLIDNDELLDDGTPDEVTAELCRKCAEAEGLDFGDLKFRGKKIQPA